MAYTANDENLYDKKLKVTLDRYNKLRKDYDDVILNYNGINLIINNPTASAYPYLNIENKENNENKKNSSIAKEYRDKKYLSFKNESEVNKEFHNGEEGSFDVVKGFYKIVLIGGGSGGIAYGSTDKCGSRTGNGGAVIILNAYFPSNGTLSYKVGLGSHGLVLGAGGIDHYGSDAGGNTEIFFNNILVARAWGGEKSTVFRRTKSKITIDDSNGGKCEFGSFIRDTKLSLRGTQGWGEGMGNQNIHTTTPTYDVEPYNQYGVGGSAQATMAQPFGFADNGTNGYFSITSALSLDDGYLLEGIDVESTKVHTLGNENEIRRKFDNALQVLFKKLSAVADLVEDRCNIIGEETTEESKCEKYSEDVINNRPYNLSEVKTTNDNGSINSNGTKKEDLYIVTYDWNTKRKLKIRDYKDFLDNSMHSETYTPFIYNNEEIYVKNIPNESGYVDVYKYEDGSYVKQLNKGRYLKGNIINWESNNPNDIYSLILNDNGYINVSLVGSGGGGGGGSGGKHWYKSGAGGGSGGYLHLIYRGFKNQNIGIEIGKGGTGGYFTQRGAGCKGNDGSETILKIDNVVMATAGAGGGGNGTSKHGSSGTMANGLRGENSYNETNMTNLITNYTGIGNSAEDQDKYHEQRGMPSVYMDSNYGEGGEGGYNGKCDGYHKQGNSGKDGYAKLSIRYDSKLEYNGNIYENYDGSDESSNVILYSDYLYDLEKLNRLKEYVSTFDNWFDSDGYCQRSCQINCQTLAQK